MTFSEIDGYLRFIVRSRRRRLLVPESPHFDDQSTTYFMERLKTAKFYLEYGCGGSTVEAARQGKAFLSVESDLNFLKAIRRRVAEYPAAKGQIFYVNIGKTVEWGYPAFKTPTPARLCRWRRYAEQPWENIQAQPDLILIDGRFRLHCALYTIFKMKEHPFEILIDDYKGRPHYQIVERFALLVAMHGRMAVFHRRETIDPKALRAAIDLASKDFE